MARLSFFTILAVSLIFFGTTSTADNLITQYFVGPPGDESTISISTNEGYLIVENNTENLCYTPERQKYSRTIAKLSDIGVVVESSFGGTKMIRIIMKRVPFSFPSKFNTLEENIVDCSNRSLPTRKLQSKRILIGDQPPEPILSEISKAIRAAKGADL